MSGLYACSKLIELMNVGSTDGMLSFYDIHEFDLKYLLIPIYLMILNVTFLEKAHC
jgi:hypothetical protein